MMAFIFILLLLCVMIVVVGKKNNQTDWGHWGANILDGLIRVYCRRFHRQSQLKIHIPTTHNVILAPNHISGIDPFILITATRRPIRFMIAKEEYERPILNWMFRVSGCIPVDRNGRVEAAFRSALKAIESGELVSLFPQGGIHSETQPRHGIKPGVIKLSQLTQCPILPVRIVGIGAPGTLAQSIITRSHVDLLEHPEISVEQASHPEFREAISAWYLGRVESIGV